jgi:hypothetical protein
MPILDSKTRKPLSIPEKMITVPTPPSSESGVGMYEQPVVINPSYYTAPVLNPTYDKVKVTAVAGNTYDAALYLSPLKVRK